MFYLIYAFDKGYILFYGNKCLGRFQCLFQLYFDFTYCVIYSPTCQTVVSDPFLWYSGPVPVIVFEEEPEEAVGEPQCLVEWQADNVV